jgi:hypothetical protein|tara:strand:+ start:276 stop:521 length:246 start_codon:yes stop_codon:yes gene_type:complete
MWYEALSTIGWIYVGVVIGGISMTGIIGALTAGRNEDLHREISDLRVQRQMLKEEIFRLTKPKKRPYKRRNYKKKPPQKNK